MQIYNAKKQQYIIIYIQLNQILLASINSYPIVFEIIYDFMAFFTRNLRDTFSSQNNSNILNIMSMFWWLISKTNNENSKSIMQNKESSVKITAKIVIFQNHKFRQFYPWITHKIKFKFSSLLISISIFWAYFMRTITDLNS